MDKNTLLNLIKSNIENDNISIDDVKKELDNYYICPLDKKNSLIIENRIKKNLSHNNNKTKRKAFDIIKDLKIYQNKISIRIINLKLTKENLMEFAMKIATENKIQGKNKDKNVPNLITNYITILGTHFYDRLKNSDKRLIEGMEAYVYINNNRKRHECSWCSKVCKYLNEHLFNNDKYYIYDSNVLNRLNIYRKYYKLKKTQKENLNIKSSKNWYTNLCNSLDELRKEIGTNSSRSEIEHILWGFTKYNVDLVRI